MYSKITLYFTISIVLQLTIHLNGQISYDLENFQTPAFKFRALNLGTALNGTYDAGFNQNSSLGSGNLQLNFTAYANNDNYVGRRNFSLTGGASFANSETQGASGPNTIERFNQAYQLNAISENRFYRQERSGRFFGLHAATNQSVVNWQYTSQEDNTEEARSTSLQGVGQLYLGFGKGRIEPVIYARLAYDTYAFLSTKNRLLTAPDPDQIEALAAVMTRVGNARFFDSRFGRIFQLEQIDSAVRASGLLSEADMVYFAQLADIWGYANRFDRGSGDLWEVGVVGDLYGNRRWQRRWQADTLVSDVDVYFDNHSAVYGYFMYTNQRPLSIKWQRDYSLAVYAGMGRNFERLNTMDENLEPTLKSILRASYELGFYPNTRTFWQTGIYGLGGAGESMPGGDTEIGYALSLYTNFYYWISPRFRLSMNAFIALKEDFQVLQFDPLIQQSSFMDPGLISMDRRSAGVNLALSYALF